MNLQKYEQTNIPDWFRLFLENDYAHLWAKVDRSCGRIDKVFWLLITSLGGVVTGLILLVLALLGKI